MVPCEDCPTLWARFYELETNRGLFSATVTALKNMIYRKSGMSAGMVIVGITKMVVRY